MDEAAGSGAANTTAPIPTARARARLRLERFGRPRATGNPTLEPLLALVRANHPRADLSIIEQAYDIAEFAHRDQKRKSGEPYITHPLAVASILAGLGMPPDTLAAALLHDVVEDTDYPLEDIRRQFGKGVAGMVDGVTKLDKVKFGDAAVKETLRKMVIAMAGDIRVLVIKLADRLHNARTWQYVPPESAQRKAAETLDIYAPLAHRLGMNTIKWELEDLSFQTLYPKIYDEIKRQVADRAGERAEYLASVQQQIEADLAEARVKASVTGRPKHYYSVYQKMMGGNRGFDDIHDLVALRVLVDTSRDCYAALGALHARWKPITGRFKDYIAMPKFNMYQSLHTTVIGPAGRPVEVQIRTWDMHRRAEYGVAAHWKYKENKATGRADLAGDTGPLGDMAWLKQVLDWQRETADPDEFLDSLRYEINTREVYVFTPKGDVMALPAGSTPVDFAYAVHTEVGHRTVGARVNGRLVPLESVLENGDVVDVLTSKAEGAGPSRDWLQFVKSPRARNKIRQWFSKSRREEAIDRGKDAIAKALRRQHLTSRRCMPRSARTTSRRSMSSPVWLPRSAGRRGCPRTPPRSRTRTGKCVAGPRTRACGWWAWIPRMWSSSSSAAAPRSPEMPSSASSPAVTESPSTARTARMPVTCGSSPTGSSRWNGPPGRDRSSWCRSSSRPWIAIICWPTLPGCFPTIRSTSLAPRCIRPRSGSPTRPSCSSSGIQPTWSMCSTRCAMCRASSR